MSFVDVLGWIIVGGPIVGFLLLCASELLSRPFEEAGIASLTKCVLGLGLAASVLMIGGMLLHGSAREVVDIGNLAFVLEEHYHFHIKFQFDLLSLPMLVLTYVLCSVVCVFTQNYLHRDRGYRRFMIVFNMFLCGLLIAFSAATIETLFLGWELVGLSSALLIAYFHERTNPVQNGLWVWSVYRVADASFLMAAVVLHHRTLQGDLVALMGSSPWPYAHSSLNGWDALIVGTLLLIAASAKSGLLPFSGWVPRAMEGPTPSSAIFYGALSIHLGAFLLLRISPIFEQSFLLRCMVIALGGVTAIFASIVCRVQTDVKSALAYASICQVGIIVVEIGLGLWILALLHIIGHACLRSLQLLRAPSLLLDYRSLENAIGGRLTQNSFAIAEKLSPTAQSRLYRFALGRGFTDNFLLTFFVHPFVSFFRICNSIEESVLASLSRFKSTR